jgi:phosphate-selective porin OprO/OprP
MMIAFRRLLLAGAALTVLSTAASAQPGSDTQAQIQALQRSITDLQNQVQQLKQASQTTAAVTSDNSAAVNDLKRSSSDQYADLNSQLASVSSGVNRSTIDNGRFQISSPDNRFSVAVRLLAQYDTGYYSQSHAASLLPASYAPDFSSGSNFRRMYLGLSGRVFGDWTYNANFDFGGSSGTETPGHIQSVYLEYDGLGAWGFRAGAYPPPSNIEDSTSSGDTLFLERNAPSDLQRNLAGGDGRDAISVLYMAPTVFGALSYTGDKIADGAKALAAAGATAAPTFGEQQGLVGRAAWLPVAGADANWLIGVNGTYVIRPPNSTANGAATLATTPGAAARNTITLSDPPELTVDSNGYTLANTTALNAKHLSQWGVETAGNWHNFYGQAGYYNFQVDRAPAAFATTTGTQIVNPSNDSFGGWYVQGSWILTGESHLYNPATGSFAPPRVAHPLRLDGGGGAGAFELALRYSDLDLNDNVLNPANVLTAASGTSRTYDYYNTVRGGNQRIFTAGLNWYPNNAVRIALNYELTQNSKLQSGSSQNPLTGLTVTTAGTPVIPTVNGGQNLSAMALRAQLSL